MKKKGFTLIELLAVIVILAIISLIITPTISKVLESARKNTAVTSANHYKTAIDEAYSLELLTNLGNRLNGRYTLTENGIVGNLNLKVDVSGRKPTNGWLVYDQNLLRDACLVINGYEVTYKDGKFVSTGKGDCEIKLSYYSYKGNAVYNENDIPDDWDIYIKQTPDGTTTKYIGISLYYTRFYDTMQKCEQNQLVSQTSNSYDNYGGIYLSEPVCLPVHSDAIIGYTQGEYITGLFSTLDTCERMIKINLDMSSPLNEFEFECRPHTEYIAEAYWEEDYEGLVAEFFQTEEECLNYYESCKSLSGYSIHVSGHGLLSPATENNYEELIEEFTSLAPPGSSCEFVKDQFLGYTEVHRIYDTMEECEAGSNDDTICVPAPVDTYRSSVILRYDRNGTTNTLELFDGEENIDKNFQAVSRVADTCDGNFCRLDKYYIWVNDDSYATIGFHDEESNFDNSCTVRKYNSYCIQEPPTNAK